MKLNNEIKLAEEQREQERKRNVMVLIHGYLSDNGYRVFLFHYILLCWYSTIAGIMKLQKNFSKKQEEL